MSIDEEICTTTTTTTAAAAAAAAAAATKRYVEIWSYLDAEVLVLPPVFLPQHSVSVGRRCFVVVKQPARGHMCVGGFGCVCL